MMQDWLAPSLIVLVVWGIWGFFSKMATTSLDWRTAYIISFIGTAMTAAFAFFYLKPSINPAQNGVFIALLSGITATSATIIFYLALSKGPASIIVPLTAMYPVVTVVLAFVFLKESVTLTQALGIAFAIVSIFLISL